jgi:hypothetical protein
MPTPRRRRPATNQASRDPRQSAQKKPKFLDAHVRIGLEDILIRIPIKDWQIVLVHWILGKEDIILRGRYDGQETNIVLRGTDSGSLTIRAPQPRTKIPIYRVVRAIDERAKFLNEIDA